MLDYVGVRVLFGDILAMEKVSKRSKQFFCIHWDISLDISFWQRFSLTFFPLILQNFSALSTETFDYTKISPKKLF